MNILIIGDIFGKPGRNAIKEILPQFKEKHNIEFVIANGENAAGGNGITPKIANQLFNSGVDVLTSGDHIWKNREIFNIIDHDQRLLRPANYPTGSPGNGYGLFVSHTGNKIGVINLMGRVFLSTLDCPFKVANRIVNKLLPDTKIIIVDFHAEATSEKMAMGWHLDGRVSCVAGTHTHVPTRDARVLPRGTGYITDLGMVGSIDSVIGIKKESALRRFITQMPARFSPATDNVWLYGIIVTVDQETGKATKIQPVSENTI